MIKVRKGKPLPFPVPLKGGAAIILRPAESFQVEFAKQRVAKLLAGLLDAEDSASMAMMILGDEFEHANFHEAAWVEAAARRLSLLELATMCVVSWSGFIGEDDEPLELSQQNIALVLRDPTTAETLERALNAGVHEELAEKNELAALPSGGAAMDDSTAQDAGRPDLDARSADAA